MKFAVLDHDGLDWDSGNIIKIEARVSVKVVEDFFKQKLLIKEDPRHSWNEKRFLAMGYTRDVRCFIVAYTIRFKEGQRLIRPISARYTHKKEERAYEAEVKKLQEK